MRQIPDICLDIMPPGDQRDGIEETWLHTSWRLQRGSHGYHGPAVSESDYHHLVPVVELRRPLYAAHFARFEGITIAMK